jgi:hypothetical protein
MGNCIGNEFARSYQATPDQLFLIKKIAGWEAGNDCLINHQVCGRQKHKI